MTGCGCHDPIVFGCRCAWLTWILRNAEAVYRIQALPEPEIRKRLGRLRRKWQ